ncbi:Mur ligase [Russula vinacea]|nr:Mur ligase [Russula vinacea]
MDLSLERIKVLLSHLPQYTLPTIHITGTNGKGSVSSFVASILQASGFTVGRFNSPHLISVLDSIIINGEPVGFDLYNDARRVSAKLDIVVLEVGMGGRTDATNAKFLGDTVGAIARQKAGIARKGRPFVVGPQKYPDVMVSVRTVVEEEVGAELVCAGPAAMRTWDEAVDGPPEPASAITSSLPFRRPAAVRPVSLSLPCFGPLLAQLPLRRLRLPFRSRITPSTIAVGVRSTSWAGRLSLGGGTEDPDESLVVLDLNLTFVLALSHSPPKTPLQTLSPLLSFERPTGGMPWVRPVPSSEIRDVVKEIDGDIGLWTPREGERESVANALLWAHEGHRKQGGRDLYA